MALSVNQHAACRRNKKSTTTGGALESAGSKLRATMSGQAMTEARSAPASGLSARNVAAMFLLAVMWGLSIPATKLGLETVPPLMFTAMRFLVAVPLLMVMAFGRLSVPWRAVPSIIGLGVMGIGLGNVGQSFGVAGSSASAATIMSATIPIFVVIFAALRLKQSVTPRQWLGLLAAFAGIALVAIGTGSGADEASRTTPMGVFWMMASALAIAFYYIWSAELSDRYGTMPVAAWNSLAGALVVLPFAGWEIGYAPYEITAQAIWMAVYLGSMVSVAGLLLWLYLLRNVPARIAASVQYLQPVFGIGASAVLFGDKLGALFTAGVALILCGLALAVANKRAPEEAVPGRSEIPRKRFRSSRNN